MGMPVGAETVMVRLQGAQGGALMGQDMTGRIFARSSAPVGPGDVDPRAWRQCAGACAEPMHEFVYLASQSPRRVQLLDQIGGAARPLLPGPDEDAEALEAERRRRAADVTTCSASRWPSSAAAPARLRQRRPACRRPSWWPTPRWRWAGASWGKPHDADDAPRLACWPRCRAARTGCSRRWRWAPGRARWLASERVARALSRHCRRLTPSTALRGQGRAASARPVPTPSRVRMAAWIAAHRRQPQRHHGPAAVRDGAAAGAGPVCA